ncbi:trypsin-like serine peptidase [Peredibacter starrii]|uniref:Serine protease n=1 Tax=Peredibacter starrii TaxID=28202 RepID=A0AAX4HK60_9BACT|nr:serine protease [Peredibacter starrii]WPU63611.1 serine protease [Peredibacter starrii]
MKLINSILVLSTIAISAQALASNKQMDVIYGEDNRMDVFESRDSAMVELSRSTAAMIAGANLKKAANGEIAIQAETLESRGVCKSERFSQQITAANCSGFLVSENVLVTAGHCIKDNNDCASWKWVFDYKVDSAEQGTVNVAASNIYSCKRIISRTLDQVSKDDYAVIELDRKVANRRPLTFRRSGKIASGTAVTVIGHPTGLPTKIADGANVRSLNTKYFVANLDTYGGNSGSAVFNSRTGEVEGILVRGENDYVYSSAQGCQVSNKCPSTGCRGEDVTYITNIEALRTIR